MPRLPPAEGKPLTATQLAVKNEKRRPSTVSRYVETFARHTAASRSSMGRKRGKGTREAWWSWDLDLLDAKMTLEHG